MDSIDESVVRIRNSFAACGPDGGCRYCKKYMRTAVRSMLQPVKNHRNGCLRSNIPEVIIAGGTSDTNEQDVGEGEKGDLASSLYFKRCDGVFKNVKGEKLET